MPIISACLFEYAPVPEIEKVLDNKTNDIKLKRKKRLDRSII